MASNQTSWQPGQSGNPLGSRKRGRLSIDRYAALFLKKQLSPKQLDKLFRALLPCDQLRMLEVLLPFAIARKTPGNELDELPEAIYIEFREFLRQKQQPVIFIEDGTTEEKQN
jgi:hypothetical protein